MCKKKKKKALSVKHNKAKYNKTSYACTRGIQEQRLESDGPWQEPATQRCRESSQERERSHLLHMYAGAFERLKAKKLLNK